MTGWIRQREGEAGRRQHLPQGTGGEDGGTTMGQGTRRHEVDFTIRTPAEHELAFWRHGGRIMDGTEGSQHELGRSGISGVPGYDNSHGGRVSIFASTGVPGSV